jgi:hypothetical protein
VGVLLCRDSEVIHVASSVYSITVFSQIVTIWLCVCISDWNLGEREKVRVGVLLCRDS